MKSFENQPQPIEETGELGQQEEELSRDSLSIKELKNMLAEIAADEESVLKIIDDIMLEPVPDPDDIEASEEFAIKMALLKEIAKSQLGRSDLLLEIYTRIDEKVHQTER